MTPSPVGALYDALQAFEGPRRGSDAYPIHKRIMFPGTKQGDVYEWLGDQLDLRRTDRVLDVGCGVGFGTIHLAERGVASATGITISQRELDGATRAAARSRRADAVVFHQGSFDRLSCGTFDVIVAVESLKHSSDLTLTVRGLHKALAPGGRLAIVEDVFDGDASCASARRVVSDWLLTRLYRETDFSTALSPATCRTVDLTVGVHANSRFALAGKLCGLNLGLAWQRPSRGAALRAFRGGLHLERLYAAGMMRYVAMFWSKDDGGP